MPDIVAAKPATGAPIDTPWGQAVHDILEGLQSGTANVVLSSASSASTAITFPRAYAVAPVVMATLASAPGGSNALIPRAVSVTTTGFSLFAYHAAATAVTVTISVSWFAIGPPA